MSTSDDQMIAPAAYGDLLNDIKARIQAARSGAALAVNRALVEMYWEIGTEIVRRVEREGWGARVIGRLAADLRAEFPAMTGLSERNLRYMRTFATTWPGPAGGGPPIGQQPVAQLPWGHNIILLSKLNDRDARLWYAQQTIEHGWSRAMLETQIANSTHLRAGAAVNNFPNVLHPLSADRVNEIAKDPYYFEFVDLAGSVQERQLEQALIDDVQAFLTELGRGFAFYGRQVPLTVGGEEFFVDLLFYHHTLRRFVVIELKVGKFKPEFAGKMNFYLNAVDQHLRVGDDQESVGIILCTERDRAVAQVALKGLSAPIAVATWHAGQTKHLEPSGTPVAEADALALGELEDVGAKLVERVSRHQQD